MTRAQESGIATATKLDTANIHIWNAGDYTRWAVDGNPNRSDLLAVGAYAIDAIPPGEWRDRFITWSIEYGEDEYAEIKHEHTGGFLTVDKASPEELAKVRDHDKGNVGQKWIVELRRESSNDMYALFRPKEQPELALSSFPFSPAPGAWGHLYLRVPDNSEYPNYLFLCRDIES